MEQNNAKMYWINKPLDWSIEDNNITMIAGKETNLFNSPSADFKCSDFPFYGMDKSGDFIMTCQINPSFHTTFDLGCLVVWENEDKWIKFAYEFSDIGCPSMVSVVTNVYSDDCNGPGMKGPCWLRISRKDNLFALHFSKDKQIWSLFRIFRMEMSDIVKIGISAQCPLDEKVSVEFNEFTIEEYDFKNQREGK